MDLSEPTSFAGWIADLETRHLADLSFPEVSRALRALSSAYVERRHTLREGGALSGAGKRAAFALFYGPLHFLLVRHMVESLPGARDCGAWLTDLGCGTGAGGAAWATACTRPPRVLGIDRHPWSVAEAARTYRHFGLSAATRRDDATEVVLPKGAGSILAAFTVNELSERSRDTLLTILLACAAQHSRVLVVEPLAKGATPWWNTWRRAFEGAGGRADEWRFRTELPPIVAKLDRAAGLNHRELTGRSLWCGGKPA